MNILTIFITFIISLDICPIFGLEETEREQNIIIRPRIEGQNIHIDRSPHIVNRAMPLYITIENFNIDNIHCSNYHTSYKFECKVINRNVKETNIKISSVTGVMNGIWECTFKTFYDNAIIHFEIKVLDVLPPQRVMVNNVVLPLYRQRANEYTTAYYYKDGETLDIQCLSRKKGYSKFSKCSLNVAYFLKNSKSDNYKLIPGRIMLNAKHNNSHISCAATCQVKRKEAKRVYSVIVKLFLKGSTKLATRLEINNTEVALTTMGYQQPKVDMTFYVNYAYFTPDRFNVVCDLLKKDYYLSLRNVSIEYKDQIDEGTKMKLFEVVPKSYSKLIFNARDQATTRIIEELVITFTYISVQEYDIISWEGFSELTRHEKLTTTTTNYIDFRDDYVSKAVIFSRTSSTTMKSASTSTTNAPDIRIRDDYASKAVIFSSTSSTITTIAPEIEPPQKWVAVLISVSIIIALIIISAVVYKMRKHTLFKRETYDNYEEPPTDDHSSIPAYPEQWNSEAAYTNLTDIINKRKSSDDKEDEVYATPDVKYETLVNPKDIDYQNLKIFNNTEVVPKDVYAQVIPKSKRHEKTYANISKKLTPENEHTLYCEINSPK